MKCTKCGRNRALMYGLCDDCTIATTGQLFPWLPKETKANNGDRAKNLRGIARSLDGIGEQLKIIAKEIGAFALGEYNGV